MTVLCSSLADITASHIHHTGQVSQLWCRHCLLLQAAEDAAAQVAAQAEATDVTQAAAKCYERLIKHYWEDAACPRLATPLLPLLEMDCCNHSGPGECQHGSILTLILTLKGDLQLSAAVAGAEVYCCGRQDCPWAEPRTATH